MQNRQIKDAASQKPLWTRANPGVKNQGPATKNTGDMGKNSGSKNTLPATKSLSSK
jgi:hypothetical protein